MNGLGWIGASILDSMTAQDVTTAYDRGLITGAEYTAARQRQKAAAAPTPTDEQLAALRAFALENGRAWKAELRHAWETGSYCTAADTAALQQVRNTLGPSWLVAFRLT